MPRQPSAPQMLQHIPKKWAVAIVAGLILYALLQPICNSRLGWHLPSLASLLNGERPSAASTTTSKSGNSPATKASTDTSNRSSDASNASASLDDAQDLNPPVDETSADEGSQPTESTRVETRPAAPADVLPNAAKTKTNASSQNTNDRQATASGKSTSSNDPQLKFGLLKSVGNEVYLSPAGLRYTRGSEEGHRLKHVERHLSDIPDRPGKHGVFDGDMPQVLRWIDDAYTRGKQGAKGVRKQQEDDRTVYEVPFAKPIGYIGGRDGKRARNPEAKKLRLVVEGDRVITAFPF